MVFSVSFRIEGQHSKSMFVGIGCTKETINSLAAMIGCKSGKLTIVYGLPIRMRPRSKALWVPMIDKFEKKLSLWKKEYLSMGGRITSINSCLSNLPMYYMSLFKMPKSVV